MEDVASQAFDKEVTGMTHACNQPSQQKWDQGWYYTEETLPTWPKRDGYGTKRRKLGRLLWF